MRTATLEELRASDASEGLARLRRATRRKALRMRLSVATAVLVALGAAVYGGSYAGYHATSHPLPLESEPEAPVNPAAGGAPGVVSPSRPGLVFAPVFSSAESLRESFNVLHWKFPYNNELQTYEPASVAASGGLLTITATKGGLFGPAYSSGMVSTQKRLAFEYGRVTITARLVNDPGLWPAFWLLPESGAALPEVDIVEERGQLPDQIWMAQHWRLSTGGASDHYHVFRGADFSQGFHRYQLIWTPGELVWLIDGVQVFKSTEHVPHVPMYLLMNLAVGGTFVGTPGRSSSFPVRLTIRSVTIMQPAFPAPPQLYRNLGGR
ncbi:MAG: glycoside hydrolase family 16 protein [Actinomycetota bacterium]|nr:glycoside hydrolase family 16 protein [Actinomycetota bacterium]